MLILACKFTTPMRKIIINAVMAMLALGPVVGAVSPSIAKAASFPTNTAVRGSSSITVYWYANDGKRYVFPNATTYYTWFDSFDSVRNVTDSELSGITLAGNVTFRPGAKLVKVTTDPKVYAVSRNGVLRWVTSEYLASQLYGSNWAQMVKDVPDVYFTNYTIGSPIYNVSDFNVSNEYNSVSTPSDSLRLSGSNNNSTSGYNLTADRTSINTGDTVNLSMSIGTTGASIGRIEIYDTRNSSLLRTCSNTTYCYQSVYPQKINSYDTQVQYEARIFDTYGNRIATAYSPVIYFNGSSNGSGSSQTYTGSRFTTTVNDNYVSNGDMVTFTANLLNTSGLSTYRIEIRDTRSNGVIQTCYNTSTCSVSSNVYNNGSNYAQFSARLLDAYGALIASDNFPNITIGSGSGNFGSGSSSVSVDRTSVNSNESVTITATASNLNTAVSNIRMELYRESNGQLLDTCYDALTCYFHQTVTNDGSNAVRYYVIVRDDYGNSIPAAYSSRITINSTCNNGFPYGNTNCVASSLTSNTTSISPGSAVQLHAIFSNYSVLRNGQIQILDSRTQTIVQTCHNTTFCDTTVYPYRNNNESYVQYLARWIYDGDGSTVETVYSPVIYFNGSSSGSNGTGTATLEASRTSLSSGETVVLTAHAWNAPANNRLEIHDNRNGNLVGSCSNVTSCPVTVTAYRNNTSETNIQYYVVLKDGNGYEIDREYGPVIYWNGSSTGNGGSVLGGTTDIYVSPSSNLHPNMTVYITASITNPTTSVQNITTRVYTEANGLVSTCNGVTVCSVPFNIPSNGVNTRAYAQFSSNDGQMIETAHVSLISN